MHFSLVMLQAHFIYYQYIFTCVCSVSGRIPFLYLLFATGAFQRRDAERNNRSLTDQAAKINLMGDTMYYKEGVTDPTDYCVLKFTAFSGRYYSGFKSEDFSVE